MGSIESLARSGFRGYAAIEGTLSSPDNNPVIFSRVVTSRHYREKRGNAWRDAKKHESVRVYRGGRTREEGPGGVFHGLLSLVDPAQPAVRILVDYVTDEAIHRLLRSQVYSRPPILSPIKR